MPKILDITGKSTDRANPKRLLWYGMCGYWTDDWDKLKKNGGIPCCPNCRSVGMQIEAGKWEEGAKKFEEEGHPLYTEFVAAEKELCHSPQRSNFLQRYETWMKERKDA